MKRSLLPSLTVLGMFCWMSINNGLAWFLYAPVAHYLHFYYGISNSDVELLDTWSPIVCLLCVIPSLYFLSLPSGLRRCVVVGAGCEVLAAGVKLVSACNHHEPYAIYLAHVGQILSAISGPIVNGAPSLVSSMWFPAKFRTRATAAGVLSNSVGYAVAFLLVPLLTNLADFRLTVGFELLSACSMFVCAYFCFPQDHAAPYYLHRGHIYGEEGSPQSGGGGGAAIEASAAQPTTVMSDDPSPSVSPNASPNASPNSSSEPELLEVKTLSELLDEALSLLRRPTIVALICMYTSANGAYIAWNSLIDERMDLLIGTVRANQLSFVSCFAYIVGGLVVSYITDKYFHSQMKAVVIATVVMTAGALFWFGYLVHRCEAQVADLGAIEARNAAMLLHHRELPPPTLRPSSPRQCPSEVPLLMTAMFIAGFGSGGGAPVFYELLAELTFPVDEGVSGTFLTLSDGFSSVVVYQVLMKIVPKLAGDVLAWTLCCLAMITVLFVREEHLREAAMIEAWEMYEQEFEQELAEEERHESQETLVPSCSYGTITTASESASVIVKPILELGEDGAEKSLTTGQSGSVVKPEKGAPLPPPQQLEKKRSFSSGRFQQPPPIVIMEPTTFISSAGDGTSLSNVVSPSRRTPLEPLRSETRRNRHLFAKRFLSEHAPLIIPSSASPRQGLGGGGVGQFGSPQATGGLLSSRTATPRTAALFLRTPKVLLGYSHRFTGLTVSSFANVDPPPASPPGQHHHHFPHPHPHPETPSTQK